ncbi:MAG: ADP-ribosylglycohydrolase family protein [Bacillota bacterium]
MKAWQYELEKRKNAEPVPLSNAEEGWSGFAEMMEERENLLAMFWQSQVPGSKAPEALFIEMIQAWSNRGYDVSTAEKYIEEGLDALAEGRMRELEIISARIMKELREAPVDDDHSYWRYENPTNWDGIRAAMNAEDDPEKIKPGKEKLERKILAGWQGQIAGGAYGTALEGYTGETLEEYYGDKLNYYVSEPDTYNDDITFQIAFLKALSENGSKLEADHIADKWLELIPFGWSAEYFALENLKRGLYPPLSGSFNNFFSEWIGAQMRTMICGFTAPGDPLKAAYYAYLDSSVSHEKNGIYGGIHSAVMTSLAFNYDNTREIVYRAKDYIPAGSEFNHYFKLVLKSCENHQNAAESWNHIKDEFKKYNWIHTYPNMAAVVTALYYSENSFDRALRILAGCGLDVDCNAGEVGSIMGVMNPELITEKWTDPFAGKLKTYLPGYEELTITGLANWTVEAQIF